MAVVLALAYVLLAWSATESAGTFAADPTPADCGGTPCAFLRVYALTPERVVIPTIDIAHHAAPLRPFRVLVTLDCGGLFQWDYFNWNEFAYIPVGCLGTRVLTVTFNGISHQQVIHLDAGDVTTTSVVFSRTQFDLSAALDQFALGDSIIVNRPFTLRGMQEGEPRCPTNIGFNESYSCPWAFRESIFRSGIEVLAQAVARFYFCEVSGFLAVESTHVLNAREFSYRQRVAYDITANHSECVSGDLWTQGNIGYDGPISIPPTIHFQEWFVQYSSGADYPSVFLADSANTAQAVLFGGSNPIKFVSLPAGRHYTRSFAVVRTEPSLPLLGWRGLPLLPTDPDCTVCRWSGQDARDVHASLSRLTMASIPFDMVGTGIVIPPDVDPPANRPPTASFSATPNPAAPNETVHFDASASTDADGVIAQYRWDFGDGTVFSGATATIVSHAYQESGDYVVRLTVEDDDGATAEDQETVVVNQLPDLEVFEVEPPIQVAIGANLHADTLDLVRGKATRVRVELFLHNALTFPQDAPITTHLFLNHQEVAPPITRSLAELIDARYQLEFYFTPDASGDVPLKATVETPITELRTDNNSETITVNVHQARPLDIAYLRVDCNPPSLTEFRDTVDDASRFIAGFFPVAEARLFKRPFDVLSSCSPLNSPDQLRALAMDARALWIAGKRASGGMANKVMGVVSRPWLDARQSQFPNERWNGATWCRAPMAFFEVGRWTTAGHELLHTFGFMHQQERRIPRGCVAGADGDAPGFWVAQRRLMETPSLMAPDAPAIAFRFPEADSWIHVEDYRRLFARQIAGVSDPEILLVSGIARDDGQVELGPLYRLPSGIVDDSDPGAMSIRLLDENGSTLQTTAFEIGELAESDAAAAPHWVPFAFAVPYHSAATQLRIERDGIALVDVNLSSRLLMDAVMTIPDRGFVVNARQRRNALLEKIRGFEALLAAGDVVSAANKLSNDVGKHLREWLVDGYLAETPLQVTKIEMLELVEAELNRLTHR